jgi:exosortase
MHARTSSFEIGTGVAENHGLNRIRTVGFIVTSLLPLVFVWISLRSLAAITLRDDTYSHIPLIPLLSLFLIFADRRRIISRTDSGWKIGSVFLLAGVACFALGELKVWHGSLGNELSIAMLGVVLAWTGAFALFFGASALRAARFPFLFLVFMVPIPEPLLSRTILLLQQGSADVSAMIFNVCGIPVLRQGFDFALPGVVIRVAEECSGIRSTLALFMMAVLASHLFLRRFWKEVLLCLLVFPVAIFKNGLRIVTLSTLAVYVDPGFLHGRLHEYGGMVFFAAGLVPLACVLSLLQKTENAKSGNTLGWHVPGFGSGRR